MRTYVIWAVTIAFFVALCFGAILQDRMRRKAGASVFSLTSALRCLGTRELYLFVLLILSLALVAFGLFALDDLKYLDR